MPSVQASVDIHRRCEDVFAFVMSPANAKLYDPAVLRYETMDSRSIHLGSQLYIVARFLPGITTTVTSSVTEWQDDGEMRRVVFSALTGPIPARGVHTFRSMPNGTHYTTAMEWDQQVGPLAVALNVLMRLTWAGKLQRPLNNLKRLLETATFVP